MSIKEEEVVVLSSLESPDEKESAEESELNYSTQEYSGRLGSYLLRAAFSHSVSLDHQALKLNSLGQVVTTRDGDLHQAWVEIVS